MSDYFTNESRKGWHRPGGVEASNDDIKVGCLQRIADSVETIAKDKERLEANRDYWKREAERLQKIRERLERQNSGLRGVITRMKRKAARP
jgi:hypothetical protein